MEIEEKYPKNFQEFLEQFKDEESCRNYLFELRWSAGFICPKCKSTKKHWLTAKNMIHCGICGYQTSLTAGTIFHGTKKPLLLWFHIIWWIVAQKTGVSASNMTDFMGFGSYKTAWTWLQRIRRAMVRKGRDKIFGIVEVDKTYIGGIERNTEKSAKGAATKTMVVVAAECKGKKIGRVRFRCIKEAISENLIPFIQDNIKQGSTVITDDSIGYAPLQQTHNYKHEVKTGAKSGTDSHSLLPHIYLVGSLVKRWLQGTHQSKVSPKYLPYYLDEFAFRFNKKISTNRGWLFYKLMQQAIETGQIGKSKIVGK
ncbi:MAG: IS1595 family transposase [Bacteroidales bacterium]|nr:IS1595 family transposase [Bacteroidales bacterium]